MSTFSVSELARLINAPVERLLKQLHEAGLPQTQPTDAVTEFHKQALLAHFKNEHSNKIIISSKSIITKRKVFYQEGQENEESLNENVKIVSPKVFISYSWDSEDHKNWVKTFATMLRADGVDAILDHWHLHPGDPITHFMESSINDSKFVLIICTANYKHKSDSRSGGAGYEDSIISGDMLNNNNHRKYLPILRNRVVNDALPRSLHSKMFIDFSNDEIFSKSYNELLLTIFGERPEPPPIGSKPIF